MKFNVIVNSIKKKIGNLKERFKNVDNKKSILMGGIGVLTLLIFVVGATYAYFSAQGNSGARTDIDVITGTTDLISFSFGSEININATEENFGQGMGNLSDSTTAQALLRANNTTNSVTTRYNIYLVIEANNFEYTTENGTPEILLNVTDPNGNKVENITGLVHYENGFDITTRTGGFLLVPDYVISAGSTQTVQDWNIEVTFVNLDSDQQANTNKTLTGKIYMTQDTMSSYELTQINNFETSTTYNSITVTPEITAGSGAVEKYYYGIEETTDAMAYNSNSLTRLSNTIASVEDIDFIESDEASHTFSNLQPNSTYTVYSYTVDENNIKSNMYSTEITTDEYELPTVDSVSHSVTLNSITVNVTASGGSNSVSTYLYKIGDEEWIETESSSYTFNNLLDTTEYNIRIKVKDTDGHESTEYYEAITTEVYILPVVTSVKTETTWSSITLTPSGTNGTNTIDHYEYSIDDGDYQISNVFNNLADNHEYTIHVKAIDTAGRKSNVYTLQVTTDKYKLPTIDNVETSSTAEAITVSIDATGIDGNIVSYHYSRDDGSNYTDTPSNSYTFTNLSPNTTFYLKVYVTDSNGRVSGEYAIVTNTLNHDVTLASNNQNNIYNPSTPATLNCNGATSSYNQKYQRVEISQINNQYTNCVLTYQTPNSKNYLNNYIIGLEGTTQGSGKVLNEISVIPDYENAISISKSDYKNVTMFHNSSYSSSTGTSNSNTYTFDGNKWTSVPNNMTELNVSSYYHINFRVQTSGYYKLCYTISEGYIIDDLYVYMGSEQVFNENPSSSNSKSGCIILNYVDTNTDIRIALNTWDEPLPTITFNLQKAPNIENVNVGYRYEGKNPNNYIWFNNEMWRIIGVFDEDSHGVSGQNLVKIIRANSIGELTWDKSNINSWTNSSLMNLLNGAYLNSQNGTGGEYCYGESDYSINCDYSLIGINDAYRPMIKEVNWKLGGYYNYDSLYNPPSVFYKNERGKNSYENAPTSWSGKIGLIYPSDYGYSILNDYCERTSNLTGYNNENCAGQSWLYGKGSMWTITPDSSNSNDVFTIGDGGTSSRADTNGRSNVNPTLYLDSNVYIIGGNGTESNPYIIGI